MSLVKGMAAWRNCLPDSQGRGRRPVAKPSVRHANVAVNATSTTSLVERRLNGTKGAVEECFDSSRSNSRITWIQDQKTKQRRVVVSQGDHPR